MRIGVTGHKGNVGRTLVNRGALPLDCDVRDVEDVRRAIKEVSPDIIINTASKSKPAWCEDNAEQAIQVNLRGAYWVALAAEESKIPVVSLSTDHVFTGRAGPYKENERKLNPVNFYGETKLAMEFLLEGFSNVKIVRTSNCFWKEDPRVLWYIDRLYRTDKVYVPVFQRRSFMHIEHFAESLEKYCEKFDVMPRILHISGTETVDWYSFMREFAHTIGLPMYMVQKFRKQWVDDKNIKAKRPKRAGLRVVLSEIFGLPQYSYKDGLELLK